MVSRLLTLKLYGEYVFPGVARMVEINDRSVNKEQIQQAIQRKAPVFLLNYELKDGIEEIYHNIGTIVRVLSVEETDNSYQLYILGVNRARIQKFDKEKGQVNSWVRVNYELDDLDELIEAYIRLVKSLKKYALFMNSLSAYRIYEDHNNVQIDTIDRSYEIVQLTNKIAIAILDETEAYPEEYQYYLECNDLPKTINNLERRMYALMVEEYNERYHFPDYVEEIPEVDLYVEDIKEKSDNENEIDHAKETIQGKINEEQDELEKLQLQVIEKGIPQDKLQIIQQEIALLSREHEESRTRLNGIRYLQTVANLPWSMERKERNIKEAKEIMDASHYGMDDAKNEIMKLLAERALNEDARGTVLCLSGPPGVGKTSLVKAVANATNREFIEIKLGGVSDESVVRGFPRTYTGAEPGIFIKEMEKVDSINPVILLDEIDKISGQSNRGDVSAALLEVLDPAQNNAFRDNYLGMTYDLSKPLFIATANYLDQIPPALKDRMEVIHLEGYTSDEKLTIVQEYILAPVLREGWLKEYDIQIDEDAIKKLIETFSKEPGLRSLERSVLGMCREIALRIMLEDETSFHLTEENIQEFTNNVQAQDLDTMKRSIGFLQND